jgi:hypothetical protein
LRKLIQVEDTGLHGKALEVAYNLSCFKAHT